MSSNGTKKKRVAKPFTAQLNKQIDRLETIGALVTKSMGRAGKPTEHVAGVAKLVGLLRDAIRDLPHDFKPAKAAAAALQKGATVEIVPDLRQDLSALGESVAAGLFELLSVSADGKTCVARSKVNTEVITSFTKRQVQAPGTVRKPRAKKGTKKAA